MSIYTRFRRQLVKTPPAAGIYRAAEAGLNPRVARLVRPVPPASPTTRIGQVTEMLRVSPYRAVPVVEAAGNRAAAGTAAANEAGRLLGVITEERLVATLLRAQTIEARAALREMTAASFVEPLDTWATTGQFATEAFALMQETNHDVLPVVNASFGFMGFVSRSDLVQDLVRPFRPPVVGGMATPLGVYLTTGSVSGGAGTLALVLTGMAMLALNTVAIAIGLPVEQLMAAIIPSSLRLPFGAEGAIKASLTLLIPFLIQIGLFMLLIRLTPIAGFHAAEHQVVHALERAEPLLVENVRAMPRIHPRCGTNLVAGVLLFTALSAALQPFLAGFAFLIAGLAALAYWRTLGGWLQQYLTTRPATDAQIESGIYAARELLEKHSASPFKVTRPHVRLWRMGMLQILIGYFLSAGLLLGAGWLYPPLGDVLQPYTDGIFDGIL